MPIARPQVGWLQNIRNASFLQDKKSKVGLAFLSLWVSHIVCTYILITRFIRLLILFIIHYVITYLAPRPLVGGTVDVLVESIDSVDLSIESTKLATLPIRRYGSELRR